MLVNVKKMPVNKRDNLSKLQTLLVFLMFSGTAKNKVGNTGIIVLLRDREKL